MEYRQSHTWNPNFRKILISLKSSIYIKFIVKIVKQVFLPLIFNKEATLNYFHET